MIPASAPSTFDLLHGERVLWQGEPGQGLRLAPADAFLIPFSLFWSGGVAVAVTTALRDGVVPFVLLFLVPFVAVGLYLLVGRFVVDAWARRRTEYVVTSERVIIRSGLFSREVKSVWLAQLPEMTFRQHRDGTGTIELGAARFPGGMVPPSWPGASRHLPPTLTHLPDAPSVHELILQAQRAAQRR